MNNEWCVYVNPKLLISILLNLLRCLLAQMDVRRMCSLLLRGMFQTCPWRKSTDGLHVDSRGDYISMLKDTFSGVNSYF